MECTTRLPTPPQLLSVQLAPIDRGVAYAGSAAHVAEWACA